MGEYKRIFNLKRICLLILLVIVNIVFFVYADMQGKDVEEYIKDNREYSEAVENYQNLQLEEQVIGNAELNRHIRYIDSYKETVSSIIKNAQNLKKYSLFTQKGTFAYSNVLQTGKDFERVSNVMVSVDNDRGVKSFVGYYYMYYIDMAFMLLIIYDLFKERENGMWKLSYSSTCGRSVLALKRLGVLIVTSFITHILLYFSVFIVAMTAHGGWGDLGNPIQTIESFVKFTYPISKLEYVLVLFGVSWFALLGVSIMVWGVFSLFRKRNHALVIILIFIGIETYIYNKIDILSAYNFLRYINIVNLLRINEMIRGYLNWGFGTYVFSVVSIVIFSLLMSLLIFVVVAVEVGEDMHPEGRITKIEKFMEHINHFYQKVFSKFPILVKEMHKLIISGKALWVMSAVLIVTIYFSGKGQMAFTDNEIKLDKIYLEHGGQDFSYIQNYIAEKQQEIDTIEAKRELLVEAYNQGENVDMQEYMAVMQTCSTLQAEMSNISELKQKLDNANIITEKYGTDVWLISDRGYEEIFGQYSTQREIILLIGLIVCIMLVVSESIALEYRMGMNIVLNSSVNGRGWLSARKILVSTFFTICMTVIVYGIDWLHLMKMYDIPHINAPLLSLTFIQDYMDKGVLSIPFVATAVSKLSIQGLLVVRFIVRFIIAMLTMLFAIIISNIIKRGKNRGFVLIAAVIELVIVLPFIGWLGVL